MVEDATPSWSLYRPSSGYRLRIGAILIVISCGAWQSPAGAWTESARRGSVGEVQLENPEGSCNYQAQMGSGHVFVKVYSPRFTGAADVAGEQAVFLQGVATDEYRQQVKSQMYGPYTVRSGQWFKAPDVTLGFPSDNRTRTIVLFLVWEARNQEGRWQSAGGRALTLDRLMHLPYQGDRTYANC